MSETINDERKTGFVAHFDMLGCRNAVEYSDWNAWVALNCLHEIKRNILIKPINIEGQKIYRSGHIRIICFSDTIIIYTEKTEFVDLCSLFVTASTIFMESLVKAGIPLRGGVARGDFYVDSTKNLYCGVPFIKAYKAGEAAQWLGIVVDSETVPEAKNPPKGIPYFVEWNVPVKNGKVEKKVVVNWPFIYQKRADLSFPKSAKELYERGSYILFGPYENLANEKKGNTKTHRLL